MGKLVMISGLILLILLTILIVLIIITIRSSKKERDEQLLNEVAEDNPDGLDVSPGEIHTSDQSTTDDCEDNVDED